MSIHTPAMTTEQIREAWDALAEGFDEHVSPLTLTFGQEIVDTLALSSETRFLDVAAGSGALAIPAARSGAHVVAIDLAPRMVDRLNARAAAEGLPNLEGQVMDGEDLQFPDETFDVTASLNGVSLFVHLDAGLAEIVRVTKPGGRVVIACFGGGMQHAEFVSFFIAAAQAAVPTVSAPPEGPQLLPFQLADPERLRTVMGQAGLQDIQVNNASWDIPVRSAHHYWDAVTSSNPIAARLVSGLTSEQRDDVIRLLDGMLREHSGGAPDTVLHSAINVATGIRRK